MANHYLTDTFGLTGQTALVTGSARGIGLAIATALGRAGATVVINDLHDNACAEAVAQLTAQGITATSVCCDVSDHASVQQAKARLAQRGVRVDILVNNAGTTHRNKPALEVNEDEFDRVYRVNVKSLFWAAQAVLPGFVAQGSGVIVNVASTTGVRPGPGLVWYSGSKAAMINLTKGLALEFAKSGARINAVCPMIGETAMLGDFMGMEDTPVN